ncbi:HAD family phosphatase [Candidatus Micrarchaeota archaeon]|nr:HAD family phosphatase [Candidatus Micrarchaeota archaeon]
MAEKRVETIMKAAIFDVDGLLVNSEPTHREASRISFAEYGVNRDDLPIEVASKVVGLTIKESVRVMLEALDASDKFDEIFKRRQEVFLDLIREKAELMPGALHALQLCKSKGLKVAAASSGTKEFLELVFTKFDINDYFEVITSADDVINSKPDPQIFLITAKKLRVRPVDCVVFEDADNGVAAAKAAGMKCIAINSPFTTKQKLDKADIVRTSLEEITEKDVL